MRRPTQKGKISDSWVGTSGFQYPEWKGKFYPEDLPASKMLAYYAEHFSTTEINYSFRRIPSLKAIENWSKSTPDHFRFSFKAPQKVTHFAKLRDCAEIVEVFFDALAPMGAKLGGVLFQLPPSFQKDAAVLRDFLTMLPKEKQVAFEFRHESWFVDEVYDALREANVALCVAEDETLATPFVATADFGYLRPRRGDYTRKDIARLAKTVQEQKWKEAYVYFKHEEQCVGPKFAAGMREELGMAG